MDQQDYVRRRLAGLGPTGLVEWTVRKVAVGIFNIFVFPLLFTNSPDYV